MKKQATVIISGPVMVRCIECGKPIATGAPRVTRSNGHYSVRLHVRCDRKRVALAVRS